MVLEAADVCVMRGRRPILKGISLRLQPGRITAVIGPNGAGKSTVLACLSGALIPGRGTLRLAGECLHQLSAAELGRRRAVLEQSPIAPAGFTLKALVALGIPRQVPPRQTQALVDRALKAVGLSEHTHQTIDTLSGGGQQRAHLARVLAQLWAGQALGGGHWLLLDEPTAHLDLAHQAAVIRIAHQVAAEGVGVVVVVHDLTVAAALASHVVLMQGGCVVAWGPADQLLQPTVLEPVYGLPLLRNEPIAGRTAIIPLFPVL
ncbi:Possible ABC transporter, ATP-binding component [Candidatus Synechococcus spongiarum]|uniref:Possible ABC transporter, ATP-binding component n=2 Tax=Candidatus Synechococcus spongiarum TaxID=431041 RepID=A0A161KBH2_9SYNE|nr:Possible ABC transporter, ATP-binding component [Candidatus Synechococcus spongiarum]